MWFFNAKPLRLAALPYVDAGSFIEIPVSINVIPWDGIVVDAVAYKSYPAALVEPRVGMIAFLWRLTKVRTGEDV